MPEPDYIVEIGGRESSGPSEKQDAKQVDITPAQARNRRFISVLFQCCNHYQRVYRNQSATAYEGHCPKCLRPVRVRIGNDGTSNRFFTAT